MTETRGKLQPPRQYSKAKRKLMTNHQLQFK